jgi:hypothetical protein
MEPEVEKLFERLKETYSETKILYDISETEWIFLTRIIIESSNMGLSPKLIVRLLKAAAHLIETSVEVADDIRKGKA